MTRRNARVMGLAVLVATTAGCAARSPSTSRALDEASGGCRSLDSDARRRFASADSLLLVGETDIARDRYRDVASANPTCPVSWARLGDASRALYDRDEAIASYEAALQLDPCESASAVGLFALSVPLTSGAKAQLDALARDMDDHRKRCATPGIERVGWRVRMLRGERMQAERQQRFLSEGSTYVPALLEFASNVLDGLDSGTIYVSGSDVETDILTAPARERNVLVVDFDLLNHPAYVEALVIGGLPSDMSEGDVARLSPFWSEALERRISVSEQVLRHVIDVAGERPIVFSARFRAPIVYELGDRLTLRGLSWHLDGARESVDAEDVDAALSGATLDAFRAYEPRIDATGAYVAAETQRLLTNYVHAALNGAVAAFREEDRDRVERLMQFAAACLDPLRASDGLRVSVAELAKDLRVPS